ncbi:MAG: helix-turn-helix transcriptional regulator [Treponema sp.]|nr:helix-turn-helix transcriptional regulator [Treponema sp.]
MTQDKLAELCGVTVKAIQKIESGKTWPECETYVKLANTLGLEPMELLASPDSKFISREKFNSIMENIIVEQSRYSEYMNNLVEKNVSQETNFQTRHFDGQKN